jgi:pyruvate formate-lyase/glycerol dehydratase family glycyl radical enzyme
MDRRIERLRERLLVGERPLCVERSRYFTEAFRKADGKPLIMRRAEGLANVLDNITIFIEEGELIVGNVASKPMGIELNPVRGEWVSRARQINAEPGEEFFLDPKALMGIVEEITITDEVLEEIRELSKYWIPRDQNNSTHSLATEEIYKVAESFNTIQLTAGRIGQGLGVMGVGAYTGMGLGILMSYVLYHQRHLRLGLGKIIENAEKELESLEIVSPDYRKKADFLRAVIIAHKAAIRFARRFSTLATQLALKEPDATRKKELERIASNCGWVLANPPRDFYEACQAYWFVTLLGHPSHSGAPGRFDQYMYPFYKKDLEEGRITKEEALELLQCLRIKHSQLREVGEPGAFRAGYSGGALFQNTVLGGVTPDGEDATNELSYLVLEAAQRCPTPHPTLSVRVHENIPDDFMMKALEVVSTGLGMPAFFGDKSYIQFWLDEGIPLEMARDYAIAGCVYSCIPGYTGELSGGFFNCLKVLEITLNNGFDPRLGKHIGLKTGKFEDFESFEEVMSAYKQQLAYFMRVAADSENLQVIGKINTNSQPFLTPLMFADEADPIKTGKDISEGSAPIEFVALDTVGMVNVADSLASMRQLVFDEKKISKRQLKDALAANWDGYEEIRQMCLAVPKYGNDDDYVDSLAKELFGMFVEQCYQMESPRGRTQTLRKGKYYFPDGFSVSIHGPAGQITGATPDGRYSGELLADGSVSAMRGKDINGPTALIKSAAKINQTPFGCTLLNAKFHPSALKGKQDLQKLGDLIKCYLIDLGGKHIQMNVVTKETLLEAQAHPENFRDLIVRVAGYSAYFVTLSETVQNDIINRTEHML